MFITEICVTAGRKFADPGEPGTTLCCNVHLKATVDPDETDHTMGTLQAHAERLVEAHRDRLVSSLANRRSIQRVNDRMGDAMDLVDETGSEAQSLRQDLVDLEKQPSIFTTE